MTISINPLKTMVICEKPGQGRNIRNAVGNSYGKVVAAIGHIVDIELPHEVNPHWIKWNNDVLMPPKGLYGYKPSLRHSGLLASIGRDLKTVDTVFIATDDDREGQLIGQEILEYHKFKGKVYRVKFTAEDAATLKAAFVKAKNNTTYKTLFDAGEARRQGDQIFNLTMTRVASNLLVNGTGFIGVGRVKTPTMSLVCNRELAIKNFKPLDYFEIEMDVIAKLPFDQKIRLKHSPSEKIIDKTEIDSIVTSIQSGLKPLNVITERTATKPPDLFNITTLQVKCSTWGWSASETMKIAQSVYETHLAMTYPRSDTKYLPESIIIDIPILRKKLEFACGSDLDVQIKLTEVIRTGAKGVFSDKNLIGVSSHHAIIPNIKCPDLAAAYKAMNAKERKLFLLIARSFAACVLPDYIQDITTISTDVQSLLSHPFPPVRKFQTKGYVPISLGWKKTMATDLDEKDESRALPKIDNESPAIADKIEIVSKTTQPPKRYTEGELIKDMLNAAKFIANPIERKRLENAKGIGTGATRDEVVKGLKNQGSLLAINGFLIPADSTMEIHKIFMNQAPQLCDPATTAKMEQMLDEVESGTKSLQDAVNTMANQARDIIPFLAKAKEKITLNRQTSFTSNSKKSFTSKNKIEDKKKNTSNSVSSNTKTYFQVTFDQKEKAKKIGLKWDQDAKKWYSDDSKIILIAIKQFRKL